MDIGYVELWKNTEEASLEALLIASIGEKE